MSGLKKQITALERDAAILAGGFSEVARESEPPPRPTAPVAAIPETAPTTSYRRGHGFFPGGFPREFYLPKAVRGTEPTYHHPEGTDLDFWFWDEAGRPYGIAFQGKAQKPLWHHRFKSEVERQRYMDETITNRTQGLAYKAERQAQRVAFRHTLKVGDILDSMWGYDQTNVDFYEVVGVGEKTVTVRQISSRNVRSEGQSNLVAPASGRFVGPPMVKRVSEGNSISVGSHHASPWSGSPLHETAPGWGH